MSFIDTIIKYFKQLWAYLGSDKGEEDLKNILAAAMIIVRIIALFKSTEPSPAEKREALRAVMKFYRHASMGDLKKLMVLKETGSLDSLRSYEIDIVGGAAIGEFWAKEKKETGTC